MCIIPDKIKRGLRLKLDRCIGAELQFSFIFIIVNFFSCNLSPLRNVMPKTIFTIVRT